MLALTAIGLGLFFTSMATQVGANAAGARPGRPHQASSRTYQVHPGDTLWQIAARLVGPREDPRPMVERLIRLNGIRGGVIVAGQHLALP